MRGHGVANPRWQLNRAPTLSDSVPDPEQPVELTALVQAAADWQAVQRLDFTSLFLCLEPHVASSSAPFAECSFCGDEFCFSGD
eukprot:4501437-Heterocapsa_arctica.AAC.1